MSLVSILTMDPGDEGQVTALIYTVGEITKHIHTAINTGLQQEGRKEMFYLKTHSTHFIYGYMASDMVKDHSDSERGNPLLPHGLLFSINSKGSFICTIPQTG